MRVAEVLVVFLIKVRFLKKKVKGEEWEIMADE